MAPLGCTFNRLTYPTHHHHLSTLNRKRLVKVTVLLCARVGFLFLQLLPLPRASPTTLPRPLEKAAIRHTTPTFHLRDCLRLNQEPATAAFFS